MNGRQARARHAAQRAQTLAALNAMIGATPALLGTAGGQDIYQVGPTVVAIPILRDDYPPELKDAIDRRRRAGLTGRCDCGAVRQLTRKGRLQYDHEPSCDASDFRVEEIASRHGMVAQHSILNAVAGGR